MTFDVLAIIVVLNVIATITLWRAVGRTSPRPKKKFIKALLHSKPITPKPQPPDIVSKNFSSLVGIEDRQFFGDFADFAAVVNCWLAEHGDKNPWRLQELPDIELKPDLSTMPVFGRRYAIFHNQVRLGTLEVSPGLRYSVEIPNVRTSIELDWIRPLAFDTVQTFLTDITLHVSDDPKEHLQTRLNIDRALTKVLWQTQKISEFGMDGEDWGEVELRLDGSASWYLERRETLHKQQAAA